MAEPHTVHTSTTISVVGIYQQRYDLFVIVIVVVRSFFFFLPLMTARMNERKLMADREEWREGWGRGPELLLLLILTLLRNGIAQPVPFVASIEDRCLISKSGGGGGGHATTRSIQQTTTPCLPTTGTSLAEQIFHQSAYVDT